MQDDQTAATIRRVLSEEAAALAAFAADPARAAEAARLIHGSSGPLIVTGVGKSGPIGAKIAATFRSGRGNDAGSQTPLRPSTRPASIPRPAHTAISASSSRRT